MASRGEIDIPAPGVNGQRQAAAEVHADRQLTRGGLMNKDGVDAYGLLNL